MRILSWKLQCNAVRHTVNPFIHILLHAGVHHKEALIWFKAPGPYYTIEGLFLGVLLIPCVVEILQP